MYWLTASGQPRYVALMRLTSAESAPPVSALLAVSRSPARARPRKTSSAVVGSAGADRRDERGRPRASAGPTTVGLLGARGKEAGRDEHRHDQRTWPPSRCGVAWRRDASTGRPRSDPYGSPGRTGPRQPRSSAASTGARPIDRPAVDRVDDELDVGDALARVGAQLVGDVLGASPPAADARSASPEPWTRPVPPGIRTWTATVRSTSAGSRPTARQASSTSARSAGTPAGLLSVSENHTFQAVDVGQADAPASAGPSSRSSAAARRDEPDAAAARSRAPGRTARRSRWRRRAAASG